MMAICDQITPELVFGPIRHCDVGAGHRAICEAIEWQIRRTWKWQPTADEKQADEKVFAQMIANRATLGLKAAHPLLDPRFTPI